ncbi:SCO2521 family protein [Actinoplanes sp. Pm04-4]|uniref:SCO2521 family protein n=1 Tax=Paractinoplanes pyxinae TaxID=2997416 RepID=A0ABT4BDZ7_9ACTN|nr:SCO2521 family protein [Actinoplanes pyxinae]MCY1144749.1 SCO2521 family protein [Actinoplanes pyxinae]
MLTLGEVHTGLLQNSVPLSAERVAKVLRPLSGDQIQHYERPLTRGVTADRPRGVDCRLPAASKANPHVVGTVMWRSTVVGGHLVQGSAYADVVDTGEKRRLPWSHYTASPGRLELLTRADTEDVAQGYLRGATRPDHLDTAAIAAHALDRVQRSALLDRAPSLKTRRTRLRWAVIGTGTMPQPTTATFRVVSPDLRTVEVRVADDLMPGVIGLCEDLALHDWLLTTVARLLDNTLTTRRYGHVQRTELLRPAVDYFLHLWMPGARVDESLTSVWESLERRPGFTRQWDTSVARIRDQINLTTIELLRLTECATGTSAPAPRGRPRLPLGPRPPRRR